MAVKTLDQIEATVRQLLRDEIKTTGNDFEKDELELIIAEVKTEISERRPNTTRETLTICNRSGEATATTASHLIDTTNSQFVAGDVGKTVYNSTDGTTAKVTAYTSASDLTLDTDIMASGESYYIFHYLGTSGRDLDLSDIDGLLQVVEAEYPTRQNPRCLIDVDVVGDVATLDYDGDPTDGDEVFLTCDKVHELTDSTSTLRPDMERVLVEGTVAKAALEWTNKMRTELVAAIATITSINTALTSVDARVTQAIADLTSGRAYIAKKNTEAITAIGNMTARVTQAVADLTSGRAIIGNKRSDALTAIDAMATYLTQAVTDLTSGRSTIADLRTTMDTAIDNMSARITQATTDLTTGRAKITTVNVGGRVAENYANYAVTELGNAARYLDQAKGYLAEASTSDRYANYAARDLQVAAGYLGKARGYLATDQAATEYGASAAKELQSALSYLNQARGYMAVDQPATEYSNYAGRELANGTAYLNKANGYFRKLTAELNVTASISRYEAWAEKQLALYKDSLKSITRSKSYEFH